MRMEVSEMSIFGWAAAFSESPCEMLGYAACMALAWTALSMNEILCGISSSCRLS